MNKRQKLSIVDYILEGETADPGLQKLASDNFFFTDLSENYVNSLGVFCEGAFPYVLFFSSHDILNNKK